MQTEVYRRLCVLLDSWLLRPPVTETRLSVSVLHMIRHHPVFTDLYAPLFASSTGAADRIRHLVERGRRLVILAGHLARVAVNRLTARTPHVPDEPCDVLLVSYQFFDAPADDADDMYYGRLAQELEARGVTARIVRFDSTPGFSNGNRRRPDDRTRLLLDRYLPLGVEWRHVRRMWTESRVLARTQPDGDDTAARRLPRFASNHALSMWSLLNLRRVQLVANVLPRLRPRLLVTTYEGLPWERMLYARARGLVPGIRCAGYQQAPVFRHQHAIGRALGDPYDPDVIFASSDYSRRQLAAISNYTSTRLDVLGSKRSRGGVTTPMRSLAGGRLVVLAVPEGIVAECERLFGYTRSVAPLLPDCTFIWRLHPQMRFEQLRKQAPHLFVDQPPNIVMSTEDLSVDVKRSHIALYRASSSIITCINEGLWPAYVAVDEADHLDPLYDISGQVPRLEQPDDLVAYVQSAGGATDGSAVQSFAAQYYDPLDPDRLADYIHSIHPIQTHEPS